MARHYGIPYMGSKQKIVDKIVPFILNRHPNADAFYDLFGGGGSVALYTVQKYPHLRVVYNERSKAISALMQHLKDNGDIPIDFVTRKEFEQNYKGDDWYAGVLQTCWAFGNNQKSYVYGTEIEEFKNHLHNVAIGKSDDIERLNALINKYAHQKGIDYNANIYLNLSRYKTSYQRRIAFSRQVTNPSLGHIKLLQSMYWMDKLEQVKNMPGISYLDIVQGGNYDEVAITGEHPIIYCDPPYENTAEYREGSFDSRAFYDWAMAQSYPVYISSYLISDNRFILVKAIKKQSLLAKRYTSDSYNYENLYWNGVQ